jgi:hypothetical protein
VMRWCGGRLCDLPPGGLLGNHEGHKLALEWRGKRAKPHGNRAV